MIRTVAIRTALAALAALSISGPALAQQACGPRAIIVEAMQDKWGEVEAAVGITAGGMAMLIYANAETGTYTVMMVAPGHPDVACIVATGNGWAVVTPIVGSPS